MSDSGGVNTTKDGLIKGGICAAIICAIIIGWGLFQASDYERQANNKRAEYSEYTDEKITQACIRMAVTERLECVNEAFEAKRDYEANQYDLEAQRKSALWAYIMGAAAVIGMALSAVGVWLVKTTFDETREANRLTQRIDERSRSPNIIFCNVGCELDWNGNIEGRITFKPANLGKIDANDFKYAVSAMPYQDIKPEFDARIFDGLKKPTDFTRLQAVNSANEVGTICNDVFALDATDIPEGEWSICAFIAVRYSWGASKTVTDRGWRITLYRSGGNRPNIVRAGQNLLTPTIVGIEPAYNYEHP